jgi:GAF domain-containing protein
LTPAAPFAEEPARIAADLRADAFLARTAQLEALQNVNVEVVRELDLVRLLELILRRALELVGAEAGVVLLWDAATETLSHQVRTEEFFPNVPECPIHPGEGAVGQVAADRTGRIINDYRAWPDAHPLLLSHTAITAILATPLCYRDRLLGVLVVDNPHQASTSRGSEATGCLESQSGMIPHSHIGSRKCGTREA